jgi:hypothetical protein
VWTKNYKTSLVEEDDIEMTGDGEGSDKSSRDEDYFEKQMCLVNESDKTTVRERRWLSYGLTKWLESGLFDL